MPTLVSLTRRTVHFTNVLYAFIRYQENLPTCCVYSVLPFGLYSPSAQKHEIKRACPPLEIIFYKRKFSSFFICPLYRQQDSQLSLPWHRGSRTPGKMLEENGRKLIFQWIFVDGVESKSLWLSLQPIQKYSVKIQCLQICLISPNSIELCMWCSIFFNTMYCTVNEEECWARKESLVNV